VRIPGDAEADIEEEKAKAVTRGELALLLAALPVSSLGLSGIGTSQPPRRPG
jgi:hypothetical protein